MNPRINLNGLPLQRRDELEVLMKTDFTDKTSLRTGGYDRYRKTLPGEIHVRPRHGITKRPGEAPEPPPMTYDEFIGLVLGDQNHQTVGQLLDILRFAAVPRAKGEKVGPATSRRVTGAQAWATMCRHSGGSALHATTRQT